MAGLSGRLVSLDAFRGATIAAMILVNNPGDWGAIYWPLAHAPWHGWTPTDLIFPFFLFIVGVSMGFSRKGTLRAALRRAAILFGLGLFMAAYPYFNLGTVRIPGVLQRIALCYLAAWLLRRWLPPLGQALACAFLLVLYWVLMTFVPVPGGLPANLEPSGNLGAWLDRLLLDGHLWRQSKTWDPEGVLSTIPAVSTTLLGSLAGLVLRAEIPANRKLLWLGGGGAMLTLLGLAWGTSFPINKSLWTSSYVLLSGGLGALAFALCYALADVAGVRSWTRPFVVYGTNAIFVFVASGLFARTLGVIRIDGTPLQALLYQAFFAPFLAPKNASLAYAIANVVGFYFVLLWMDRRGLYLKV